MWTERNGGHKKNLETDPVTGAVKFLQWVGEVLS